MTKPVFARIALDSQVPILEIDELA